jgi:L-iditol 2-dehydrogenase
VRAAILHAPRTLRVERAAVPSLEPGDVRLRVTRAGLCGTDYSIWSGDRPVRYPRIMGHELLGVVEAVGADVTRVKPGERVALEPNYSCGECPLCREGNRNLCLGRVAIGIDADGGFAELVKAPERCCWPIPTGVADDDLLLAEPLAVVTRAVGRGTPRAGETAAVVGAGTLGLLGLQVLRARGIRVLVVSRSTRRFALARELGAERTHALADGPLDNAAREFSGREGVDLVVETAGTADAVTHALALVRPGGRVILTGLPTSRRRWRSSASSAADPSWFDDLSRRVRRGPAAHRRGRRARATAHHAPVSAGGHRRGFAAHRDPVSIKVALEI